MVTDWKFFLVEHEVDADYGFLLTPPPDTSLSSYFAAWDQAALHLPEWIEKQVVQEEASRLPFKDPGRISSKGEMERAMLVLSFLGNAIVHTSGSDSPLIPRNVAVPWRYISTRLGRPPVLSHASAVLGNWKTAEQMGVVSLENLQPLVTFTRTEDEKWFYMVTVAIESQAAEAIAAVALALEYATTRNSEHILQQLKTIRNAVRLMTNTLKRMSEKCDPAVFYSKIRPFLASYKDVRYDLGGKEVTESWHGGSAAQSAVLQFLDAALGIEHKEPKSAAYMKQMLTYMPPKHATIIKKLQQGSPLKDYCASESTLTFFYEKAVETIHEFRTEHFKIAHEYIIAQAKAQEGEVIGTGGTELSSFLKSMRDETKKKGD
jgi:indoleamine 2,3-dioxygenase